ncbi:MAG: Iron uptake protein A1 [Gammaproteobacteria bacterium]|nr:Iron uptake protein A1 [Gammaproteobacteria bacterium]
MVRGISLVTALAALLAGAVNTSAAAEVNIYSARKEALIKPLLDRFTKDTDIAANLVTGSADALLKRLEMEGMNSPADIVITVDAGRLHRAKASNLLQPVRSDAVTGAVPEQYRDPENYWFGLSFRARPVMYAKERVGASELSTYEALADEKWKDRICIRSSNNIYNQSLVASMILANGVEAAETWARGLVQNMARPPQGGDRDQIKATAAGECDLAIANSYYLGRMLNNENDPGQRKAARQIAIHWPNQKGRGAHVNVSGIGVTRSAQNYDEAIRLIEFLVSDYAQAYYARSNYEYPVKENVHWSETLEQWGTFRADTVNLSLLGENNAAAVKLMDRAGWK